MSESQPLYQQLDAGAAGPNESTSGLGGARVKTQSSNKSLARPQSAATYNKKHTIVGKDFYRGMKCDTLVAKSLEKKRASEMGRAPKQTILELKNYGYKTPGEVISDCYSRSVIPEARLYMIDKVVRMRGQHGRFGIDHSELLNYELEQTNKPRDEHMNWLVYKGDDAKGTPGKAGLDETVSKLLFSRLDAKDEERYSDYSNRKMFGMLENEGEDKGSKANLNGAGGLSYAEWLKLKDSEKRLKRKLVNQAQNDIKEELLQVAKSEREKYLCRVKAMDEWLMKKKLEEAEKSAHLRELDRREEADRQMREELHTDSYKKWMKMQSMKKRQTRKYNQRKVKAHNSQMAREMAEHEMQQQLLHAEMQESGAYDRVSAEQDQEQVRAEQQYYLQQQQMMQESNQQKQDYNPLRHKNGHH